MGFGTHSSLVEEVALQEEKFILPKIVLVIRRKRRFLWRLWEIVLLENLRYYEEETAGDQSFAASLSKLGDIYLNGAVRRTERMLQLQSLRTFLKNQIRDLALMNNEVASI